MINCTVTDEILRNVAVRKRSYQSTTHVDQYGAHSAIFANDGIQQTDYRVVTNGCAASDPETNPWWAVDLDAPTMVCQVTLTNRGDAFGMQFTVWYITVITITRLSLYLDLHVEYFLSIEAARSAMASGTFAPVRCFFGSVVERGMAYCL